METEVAERRFNTIAAHFAPKYESSATHILPVNCSSSLNSVIRRYDNKMQFAHQGSSSQGSFMRPASSIQGRSTQFCSPLRRSSSTIEGTCNAPQAPMFSRPSGTDTYFSNAGVTQDSKVSGPDHPRFSRPNRRAIEQKRFRMKKNIHASEVSGNGWSPRMDVAEIGSNYILTVELPGVCTNGIRVEVHDRNLIVMGKRTPQHLQMGGFSKDSISAYHKKEILQGPYQVVWPLPPNVNKDRVSAEFLDGFLQIVIPKL